MAPNRVLVTPKAPSPRRFSDGPAPAPPAAPGRRDRRGSHVPGLADQAFVITLPAPRDAPPCKSSDSSATGHKATPGLQFVLHRRGKGTGVSVTEGTAPQLDPGWVDEVLVAGSGAEPCLVLGAPVGR